MFSNVLYVDFYVRANDYWGIPISTFTKWILNDITVESNIKGCTDETACNYNAKATDNGSCTYPATGYDCDGNCLEDANGTCLEEKKNEGSNTMLIIIGVIVLLLIIMGAVIL